MKAYLRRKRPPIDMDQAADRVRRIEAGEYIMDVYPKRPNDGTWGNHEWYVGYLHKDQMHLGKPLT